MHAHASETQLRFRISCVQSAGLVLVMLPANAAAMRAYLNSVSTTIYLDADQTDLRKPSRCVRRFMLSSDSPMARTKPERA